VLLHVTHPESMAALPRIAKTLSERGFKLVTLSELAQHSTGAITQSIPN
jgi:peptidoglycan/xylan/chitin deacetylase (PgdA/CDA1 family)